MMFFQHQILKFVYGKISTVKDFQCGCHLIFGKELPDQKRQLALGFVLFGLDVVVLTVCIYCTFSY